jgi:hypothetical protein
MAQIGQIQSLLSIVLYLQHSMRLRQQLSLQHTDNDKSSAQMFMLVLLMSIAGLPIDTSHPGLIHVIATDIGVAFLCAKGHDD